MSESPGSSQTSQPSQTSSKSSSSDISTTGKLTKLVDDGKDHNNFGEWKIQAEIDLLSWDLLKYVTGSESKPPTIPPLREPKTHRGMDPSGQEKIFQVPGNAAERQKIIDDAQPWLVKNNVALSKISKSIPGQQKFLIRGLQYASEAWNALVHHYQTSNAAKATALTSEIHTCICSPNTNVGEWLKHIQSLYNSLIDLNPDGLSDREFTLIVVNNLPRTADWRSFAMGLRQRANAYDNQHPNPYPVTSKEFLTSIRDEVYFIIKNAESVETTPQVFNTDSKGLKRPKSSDASSSSAPSGAKRARTSNNKTCSNPNCNKRGHDISECIAYGGGNVGNYGPKWRGPWNIHLPPFQRNKSNNCPPPSHPAFPRVAANQAAAQAAAQANAMQAQAVAQANAMHAQANWQPYYPTFQPTFPQTNNAFPPPFPQANALTYYPPPPSYSNPSYSFPPAGRPDSTNPGPFPPSANLVDAFQPFVLATRADDDDPLVATVPIFSLKTPKTDVCFYDSAANRHVFHDRTAFETYQTIPSLSVKGFGDELSVTAIGRGSVRLTGHHGGRTFPIILTNVLHIPNARANLLSGGEFTERDVKVLVQRPVSLFWLHGIIFLEAFFKQDHFYHLNAEIVRPKLPPPSHIIQTPFVAASSSQSDFLTA